MAYLLAPPALAQSLIAPAPDVPGAVQLDFKSSSTASGQIRYESPHLAYNNELTGDADELDGDPSLAKYDLVGHVRLHELDATLTADRFRVDGKQNLGIGLQSHLTRRPYNIKAETLTITPKLIQADNASFTTAPPDVSPDYELRVRSLSLNSQTRRAVLRHVAFYLFHNHLLTLPKLTLRLGGNGSDAARRQAVRPAFSTSNRYGVFVALNGSLGHPISLQYYALIPTRQSLQFRLKSDQSLYSVRGPAPPPVPSPPAPVSTPRRDYLGALRDFATTPMGPLPEGDPLLFNDFLPDQNPIRLFETPGRGGVSVSEQLDYHVEGSGRRRDDLYVSRLPEVTLRGYLPLVKIPASPTYGDPNAFRAFLRHVIPSVDASFTDGQYREDPTGLRANRRRTTLGIGLRPLLIASNTVIQPRIEYAANQYGNSKSRYINTSATLAVSHYFSDRTALGLQYIQGNVSGDSPFNFDVLDTTRELDTRLQVGSRRLTVAGLVRYDLARGNVIDYKVSVAPGFHGFTPVFSYNFRNRSVGVGLVVEGF